MIGTLPALTAFSAVIFDLDGTLYDSMGMWEQIDIEYLARHGFERPPDLQTAINGLSFQETSHYFKERFGIPDDPVAIQAEWLTMAREAYNTKLPLKAGAAEILRWLERSNIPVAIASSNHYDLIMESLVSRHLDSYISALVTCDDVKANKPDPAVYLKAAEKLSADPRRCLVFEDVVPGILAGKRAGMTVCAVADRASEASAKEKIRLADAYIVDFRELIPPVDILPAE